MRAFALFAVVLLAVASLLPAAAHGRSITVHVQITSGPPNHQPVGGAEVEIVDRDGNPLGSGVTDAKGVVEVKIELPDGVDNAVIGVDQGSGDGNGYAPINLGSADDRINIGFDIGVHPDGVSTLPVLVKRALAKCDKAEYDRWVAELDRLIAWLSRETGCG